MRSATEWTVYRTRFLVCARQLTEYLSFEDAFGREQCGCPGDYLVESSDGLRRIAPREIFEDIYVPLLQSSGDWPAPGAESPGSAEKFPPLVRPRAN